MEFINNFSFGSPLAIVIYFVIFLGVYFLLREKKKGGDEVTRSEGDNQAIVSELWLFKFANVVSLVFITVILAAFSAGSQFPYLPFWPLFLDCFLMGLAIIVAFVLFSSFVRYVLYRKFLSKGAAFFFSFVALVLYFYFFGELGGWVIVFLSALMAYKVMRRVRGIRSVLS